MCFTLFIFIDYFIYVKLLYCITYLNMKKHKKMRLNCVGFKKFNTVFFKHKEYYSEK